MEEREDENGRREMQKTLGNDGGERRGREEVKRGGGEDGRRWRGWKEMERGIKGEHRRQRRRWDVSQTEGGKEGS